MYFGKLFGFFFYVFFPLRKKVAFQNLQIAFPEKSNEEIKKIILKSYIHYSFLMFEFMRSISKKSKNKNYIIDSDTKKILNNNEGLILMTAHLGNWEMILPIISRYKKMTVVVKKQRNKAGDKFFYKARKFKNVSLIPTTGSKKTMLNSLYNNEVLGLASDQNAGKRGITIDFFNKPASIPKGAGHFYYQTKCKIVIGFCILNNDLSYDFKLQYLDIKDKDEQKEDLIVKINEKYVHILEKQIKRYPEQYFWFHKKWDKQIYDS